MSKKALVDVLALYHDIKSGKTPIVTLNFDAKETEVIGLAAAALGTALENVSKLREGLRTYANEFFYDELPPSKAKEDRGQIARRILNETAPEGVV